MNRLCAQASAGSLTLLTFLLFAASPSNPAQAADPAAAPSAAPAGAAQPAPKNSDTTEKTPDLTGELWPGVKGISGKELERQIQEFERRMREKPASEPKPPQTTTTEPSKESPPAQLAPAPVENPMPAVPETQPAVDPAPEPAARPVAPVLGPEAQKFIATLEERTTRVENLLKKAGEIRRECEREARNVGREEWLQFLIQFTSIRNDETRAYQQALMFPLTIYRGVYEQAGEVIRTTRLNRPGNLPDEGAAKIDACLARLKEAQRASLLATAELFTRMRNLKAAEKVYAYLLKSWPEDAAVKSSHEAFLKIRDAKKPEWLPGFGPGEGFGPGGGFRGPGRGRGR